MPIRIDTSKIGDLTQALGSLVDDDRRAAATARAFNHSGRQLVTAGSRAIARETQLPVRYVRSRIRETLAAPGSLLWAMRVAEPYLTLAKFADVAGGILRQTSKGVTVSKWGFHRSAFIATMPTGHTGVYKRLGKKRFPLKELWGPNMAKPLQLPEVVAELEALLDEKLPARILHEIGREIDAAKAAYGV